MSLVMKSNQPVQSQKQTRSLRYWDCTICVAKTKALISFEVQQSWSAPLLFPNADCWFSDMVAHIKISQQFQVWVDKCVQRVTFVS